MILCTRPHRSHVTTDEADLAFKENVVLVLHFRLAKFLLLALPSFTMRRTIHVLLYHGVRSLGWGGTRSPLKFGNSDHITMQGFPSLNDLINSLIYSIASFRRYALSSEHAPRVPTNAQIDNINLSFMPQLRPTPWRSLRSSTRHIRYHSNQLTVTDPLAIYQNLVDGNLLKPDEAQFRAAVE